MRHDACVTDTRTRHSDTLVVEHTHVVLRIVSEPVAVPPLDKVCEQTVPTSKRNGPTMRRVAHLDKTDPVLANNQTSGLSVECESVMFTAFSQPVEEREHIIDGVDEVKLNLLETHS